MNFRRQITSFVWLGNGKFSQVFLHCHLFLHSVYDCYMNPSSEDLFASDRGRSHVVH
jgi:hypothetical protein